MSIRRKTAPVVAAQESQIIDFAPSILQVAAPAEIPTPSLLGTGSNLQSAVEQIPASGLASMKITCNKDAQQYMMRNISDRIAPMGNENVQKRQARNSFNTDVPVENQVYSHQPLHTTSTIHNHYAPMEMYARPNKEGKLKKSKKGDFTFDLSHVKWLYAMLHIEYPRQEILIDFPSSFNKQGPNRLHTLASKTDLLHFYAETPQVQHIHDAYDRMQEHGDNAEAAWFALRTASMAVQKEGGYGKQRKNGKSDLKFSVHGDTQAKFEESVVPLYKKAKSEWETYETHMKNVHDMMKAYVYDPKNKYNVMKADKLFLAALDKHETLAQALERYKGAKAGAGSRPSPSEPTPHAFRDGRHDGRKDPYTTPAANYGSRKRGNNMQIRRRTQESDFCQCATAAPRARSAHSTVRESYVDTTRRSRSSRSARAPSGYCQCATEHVSSRVF
jgi:hypothetical protein